MAKKVTFSLDTTAGAEVLQLMARPLVQDTSRRIQARANELAAKSSLNGTFDDVHYRIGAPNKRGGMRYYGHVGMKVTNKRDKALARLVLDEAARSIKIH